jgi:dTDP-4-amino-4,6-dideoxygalactose transaminase
MRAWSRDAALPATDVLAARHLAIPVGPTLSEDDVAEVVAAVRALGRWHGA